MYVPKIILAMCPFLKYHSNTFQSEKFSQIPALFSPFYKYPKVNPSKLNDIGKLPKYLTKQQISDDFNEIKRVQQMI